MPELPEVETLRRALLPLVQNKTCLDLKFFRSDIRFPIPRKQLLKSMKGKVVSEIERKGKYLIWHVDSGAMVLHLGMSGRLIRHQSMSPVEKHTHAIFRIEPDTCLHFIDPRRFGCIVWAPKAEGHPLINHLGPDPFADETTVAAMKARARNSRAPIKSFLMNARYLAGIGNIYACEGLFGAGINPRRKAGRLSSPDWEKLLASLRRTLSESIAAGGTTLRDFFSADGSAGYYAVRLTVYGRENQPCPQCGTGISRTVHSGRSTFYCRVCQKK